MTVAHSLPNVLSTTRLLLVLVLLALAWFGYRGAFLACLAAALTTDAIDGFLARRFHLESPLGARLDSWADALLSWLTPLGVWWLWPDLVRREAPYVAAMILSYVVPSVAAYLKFGALPAYHTRLAKLAAVAMGAGGLILLLGGPAWPFRAATVLVVCEALEELAITAVLRAPRSNIASLGHALRGADQ
ncbi:MAG TPA: CDP-alcohol phosphatidyltransferase family protein [Vicinamibacterales bacterium]|nr:CDP-alcohol phosphatidyltransferase family protein [Vicinamibacterales bacterium]